MIIYGTRASVRPGEPLMSACPECGQTALESFRVFAYVHLYFLPTLPFGSRRGVECGNCLYTEVGAEVPKELVPAAREATGDVSRPIWHWAGAFLLALLVAWIQLGDAGDREAEIARMNAPVVGDLLVFDSTMLGEVADPDYPFLVVRIETVDADGIEVIPSQLMYATSYGAEKAVRRGHADRDDFFESERWPFAREMLPELVEQRDLRLARAVEDAGA